MTGKRQGTDRIFADFLDQQPAPAMALADSSDLLEIEPLGDKPYRRYLVKLDARGLIAKPDGQVVEATGCEVGVYFHDDYLHVVDMHRLLTYLGPHPMVWHPNWLGPFLCVHVRPGTPLTSLVYTVFEMFTWNTYYTGDNGLNPSASQWARQQDRSRFPIDRRPLKRRSVEGSVATVKQGAQA
jgi:hypothetical protein